MSNQVKRNSSQRGAALIFALVAILVLSILAAVVMFSSQSQVWTSLNYRQTAQARYAAEAGAQATINWLGSTGANSYPAPAAIYTGSVVTGYTGFNVNTYPVQCSSASNGCTSLTAPVVLSTVTGASNYYDPTGTAVSNFKAAASGTILGISNASYKTTATLLRMPPSGTNVSWLTGLAPQTWQITSVGTMTGVSTSSVQVVETFDRLYTPVFTNGMETTSTACGSVTLASSGSYTDSYNSSLGPYGAGNSQTSGGNIATNGNVFLGKGVTVNGTITAENNQVLTLPTSTTSTATTCVKAGVTYGVSNASGNANFDGGTYKENSTLVAKLPWGCAAQPCYPPGTNITTAQNVDTQCASITGCTVKTSVSVYDGTGSNHAGTTISANVYTLAPGSYGNLTIGSTASNAQDVTVVHVSAGTYNINSIDMGSSDAQVVIDSGPVVFNMVGNCSSGCPTESGLPSGYSSTEIVHISGAGGLNACQASGGTGVVANPGSYGNVTCGVSKTPFSGIPANMQFVYGGTYTVRLGGMPFAAAIYAPAAGYYTPGAPVGLYGSVIASQFNDSSGSPWHYDNALGQAGMKVGGYKALGFTWAKF